MKLRLSSDTADTLEAVGAGMIVLGVAWGVSRAAPNLRGPIIAATAGAGLVYAARHWSESPLYIGSFAPSLVEEDSEELDVIEGESRVID